MAPMNVSESNNGIHVPGNMYNQVIFILHGNLSLVKRLLLEHVRESMY